MKWYREYFHDNWINCSGCIRKAFKWGAILYAAHWVLHALVFLISPMLGWISLGLF